MIDEHTEETISCPYQSTPDYTYLSSSSGYENPPFDPFVREIDCQTANCPHLSCSDIKREKQHRRSTRPLRTSMHQS